MAYRVEIARNAEAELEEVYLSNQPVRVLRYGRKPHVYRLFFTVDDTARVVRVVHVRHGARKAPVPDELKGD